MSASSLASVMASLMQSQVLQTRAGSSAAGSPSAYVSGPSEGGEQGAVAPATGDSPMEEDEDEQMERAIRDSMNETE